MGDFLLPPTLFCASFRPQFLLSASLLGLKNTRRVNGSHLHPLRGAHFTSPSECLFGFFADVNQLSRPFAVTLMLAVHP
ncbi:hypothetical protein K440DRAFT_613951 [Wilcoxina mikolae CBS 423.85]|nr:hypothetical protein K440DRAFT_613951 [Wilcoxina mikolae CBS 423.85]